MEKRASTAGSRFSGRPVAQVIAASVLAFATAIASQASIAGDKQTVAYIAPSLDISYWQWVAYGVKQRAKELGMDYVEFTSENSPAKQMDNVRTALTRGVTAIVMGPVSSTSTPPVLRLLKEKSVPVAFAGIGPQAGQTDYTSAVTANNYDTGKAEGAYVCKLAKDRGSNKVAMLSLPQDRENAQKYMKGAQESFKCRRLRPRAGARDAWIDGQRGGPAGERRADRAPRRQGDLRHV